MNPDTWGVLIGFAVFVGMKFIDRLLPDGTHFKFMERFLSPDKKKRKKGEVEPDTGEESA